MTTYTLEQVCMLHSYELIARDEARELLGIGLEDKPDQPILNAARRLIRAADNAERNYALADLVTALEPNTGTEPRE